MPPAQVTAREREVTDLALRGHSNRDIAADLFLSARTVKSHLHKARVKTGMRPRSRPGADAGTSAHATDGFAGSLGRTTARRAPGET